MPTPVERNVGCFIIVFPMMVVLFFVFTTGMSDDTHPTTSGYPAEWTRLILANKDRCPDITGTYAVFSSDAMAYRALTEHHADRRRTWQYATISGDTQRSLETTLVELRAGHAGELVVVRGKGLDYTCEDGWLKFPKHRGKQLGLVKNRGGDLVIRIEEEHWETIPIPAPKVTAQIRIPFTQSMTYAWSRWPRASVPAPESLPRTDHPTIDAPPGERAPERVRRLLASLIPAGVKVLEVAPKGNVWEVVFECDDQSFVNLDYALESAEQLADVSRKPGEGLLDTVRVRMIRFNSKYYQVAPEVLAPHE